MEKKKTSLNIEPEDQEIYRNSIALLFISFYDLAIAHVPFSQWLHV